MLPAGVFFLSIERPTERKTERKTERNDSPLMVTMTNTTTYVSESQQCHKGAGVGLCREIIVYTSRFWIGKPNSCNHHIYHFHVLESLNLDFFNFIFCFCFGCAYAIIGFKINIRLDLIPNVCIIIPNATTGKNVVTSRLLTGKPKFCNNHIYHFHVLESLNLDF